MSKRFAVIGLSAALLTTTVLARQPVVRTADPIKRGVQLTDFPRTITVTDNVYTYKAGVPVDQAIKQANWGEYASWTLASSQGPIAIRKVYEELSGQLK